MKLGLLASLLALLWLLAVPALAGDVYQSGIVTPGHAARWDATHVIRDAGSAMGSNGQTGYLSEIGITNRAEPYPLCINDALTSAAGGYHSFCFGPNVNGAGAVISYNAFGGALPLPLNCDINGSTGPCFNSLPILDPRQYGAACGGADATAAIQAALNAAEVKGGEVSIPCPLRVNGTLTMSGAVRLAGLGPINYPGQQDTPGPSQYPTSGPALECTNTSGPCIMVSGQGNEIDHINFWNPQPSVPSTCPGSGPCNNWTPTVYPFVIATQEDSGWQGLNVHDVSCTSCSNFLDIEGTPDYHLYTATNIVVENIWCNPCLNTGIRMHLVDSPLYISHVEFFPQWNGNLPPLGYYMRQNLIGFDIQYVAAPQMNNIDFFATKAGIQLTNGTVTNNFGSLTFAASAVQMTDIYFDQVCQAITMPNGNGTSTPGQFALNNLFVWGDQSGFNCAAGKPMFQLVSNFANFTMSQLGVWEVDTFASIGCGTPGSGSCPNGSPAGNSSLRINDADVFQYSAFTAGQPFIKAPSGVWLTLGNSNPAAIRPAAGAGNLLGPGADGSQAYMGFSCIGGTANATEGAVCLEGGGNTADTGFTGYFTTTGSQIGYTGGCTTGAGAGCSVAATAGSIFLKPHYQTAGTHPISFDSNGAGQSIINVVALPTSCGGQLTGTLWSNSGVVQVCP